MMLRILLISDTHGNLDCINKLVKEKNAHSVIHAGDFGFYEDDSINRLSDRELKLRIVHSPHREKLPKIPSRKELLDIILPHKLLGHFPEYLEGKKKFLVPVYAIWGNHEDRFVVESLRKENPVHHLNLLDENHMYDIHGAFTLFGIGGNFILNQKAFKREIQGEEGKVQSTFHQYGKLYKKVKDIGRQAIFISHVSPGKEPLLSRLIAHFNPIFSISGHMGMPFHSVWNQHSIRGWKDLERWMSDSLEFPEDISQETKLVSKLIRAPIKKNNNWFNKLWNINLTDACDGHALMIYKEGKFSLETYSYPIKYYP